MSKVIVIANAQALLHDLGMNARRRHVAGVAVPQLVQRELARVQVDGPPPKSGDLAAAQATRPGPGAASNTVAVVQASIVVSGLRSILAGPAFLAGPQDAVDRFSALSLKLR